MSVVANVAINVDSSGAVSKLRQVNDAGSKLEQTFKGVDGKLRDASGKFIKLGDSAQTSAGKINVLGRAVSNLAASLAVADAARRYFKGFNEAEKAAAAVRTLGVDSKALEGNLLGLSQKLGGLFSQTQLLTAAYDVASSGFANAADNTKVLEAAAQGATGGLSDIGTVGNAVTSVLNAYGKSADEAASLVDGFIQTQNDGKIILNEYAGYIGKLAPTAKAAGVGINEMNAAIATITAQGVPVEATFTGLNQALVSILKPSQEAEELAKSLGIQFNEAGLRAKGFGGLLEEVKTKTGGSTTQLVKLFGSVDALKAILPLVNDDLVKYNQNVVRQANASGVAEKATQELGGTVSSEISKMVNQIGNLVRSLDTVLGPALGGIVRLINFVIAEATKGIQVLGQLFSMSPGKKIAFEAVQSGNLGAAARVLPGIDETIGEKRRKQLQQQAGAGTGFLGMGMDQGKFIKLLQQQPEFKSPVAATAAATPTPNALATPVGATVGGGSGGGGANKAVNDAKRAAEKAAEDANRLAEQVQQQLKAADDINFALKNRLAIAQETEPVAKRMLEYDIRQNEIAKEYDELKKAAKGADELALINANLIIENRIAQIEAEQQINDLIAERAILVANVVRQSSMPTVYNELETQDAALQAILDKYPAIGAAANAASTLATSGLSEMIAGTKSAEQAFAEFLNAIGDALINTAKQMIASYIAIGIAKMFAGLGSPAAGGFAPSGPLAAVGDINPLPTSFGARANGGPVAGGTPYLVGERGPELFVPGSNGGVMSNNDMRAAMGSRPGGANGSPVLNMRFQSTTINGVEYVSRDQLEAAMAQTRRQAAKEGASRGMNMTLDKIQNSPSTRSRVGIR